MRIVAKMLIEAAQFEKKLKEMPLDLQFLFIFPTTSRLVPETSAIKSLTIFQEPMHVLDPAL